MNKLLIISIIFIQTNLMAQAQVRISGYVSDAETGESLLGANIRIDGNGSVTNNYGYYIITASAGAHTIKVSYTGYSEQSINISLNKDTTLNFALKEGVELEEVVVTARQDIETKGLGAMRINLSQLSVTPMFMGERDIIKTVQFLPGISSGMESSSSLNIRGGTNDQTLYLLDDVPVYNQNHAFGLVSVFNSDALLNADVYKGGIPSIYGNRLSGVASIAIKDGNMKSHHQSISLGLLSGTVAAEGPVLKDRLSYLFTARRSFLDLLMRGAMKLMSDGSESGFLITFWDVNGKLTWKIKDNTRLSLSVYNGNDDLGGYNNEFNRSTNQMRYKERVGLGWATTTAAARLTSELSRNAFLSSSLYYSQLQNFDYYNVKTPDYSLGQRRTARMQEYGWRTSVENHLSNNNTFFFGFDASLQRYQPDYLISDHNGEQSRFINGRRRLFTAAVFAYDELKYGLWTFTPGLRASLYRTDGIFFAIEPRLKLSYRANETNSLMLAYDRMTQPVHSVNEMNYSVRNDYWLPFNERRPPVSDQISAGWKNYSIPNLTLSLEAYYKHSHNLIMIRDLEYYLDYHTDYQTGSGRSNGVELMAQYRYHDFNAMLSYTLSKTTRRFGSVTVPFKYDARHDVSLFASQVVYRRGAYRNILSANMQYRNGLPYYIADVSYPSAPQPEAEYNYTWYPSDVNNIPYYPNTRLKDFFRADLNFMMEKQLRHGSRAWQFSILNVTAHDNPYSVYRRKGKYKAFVLIPFLPSVSFRREF
ncbi:MAG: TonB-dependent receptor [Tannerella sp.]|jgi:hypothetical protein|nr:TonB-dependent receptor [Tannerella sp.]